MQILQATSRYVCQTPSPKFEAILTSSTVKMPGRLPNTFGVDSDHPTDVMAAQHPSLFNIDSTA